MGSITNLGKRPHKLLRDIDNPESGEWVDGEFIPSNKTEVTIYANIQPSFGSYLTRLLPEGDREKEGIIIFSNDWVYTARSGTNQLEADLILYRGAQWKVLASRPFGNFGEHCEAVAVKLEDSIVERITGTVGVIN